MGAAGGVFPPADETNILKRSASEGCAEIPGSDRPPPVHDDYLYDDYS